MITLQKTRLKNKLNDYIFKLLYSLSPITTKYIRSSQYKLSVNLLVAANK